MWRCWRPCWGEVPAERRRAAVQEIAGALRPGGALIVVEALFDPHRQSRDAVLALAERAGLSLGREERGRVVSVMKLRKRP